MEFTAKMISDLVGGTVEGNPDVIIRQPAKIEEATAGSITFLANMQYEAHAYTTQASAILVSLDFVPKQTLTPTMIRVENVYETVRLLLEKFSSMQAPKPAEVTNVAATVFIDDTATIGEGTSIGTFACVEKGAKIGKNTIICPQTYIGEGVEIGDNTIINAGVKIYKGCKIGNNCVIHSNVVIGADGFGFVPQEDGTFKKMPQVGIVVIEDDVEIGSNTTIDRATMGATLIKKGVKLDNLIMVAHNVEIGENTAIAAQTGIAGSTKIGKNCMIGGQVAIVGHITIADGSQIQSKSGVAKTIKEPNKPWSGHPSFGYRDFWKSTAIFRQLPQLERRLRELEKALKNKE